MNDCLTCGKENSGTCEHIATVDANGCGYWRQRSITCDLCKNIITAGKDSGKIHFTLTVRVDEKKEDDIRLNLCENCNTAFWKQYATANAFEQKKHNDRLVALALDKKLKGGN